MIRIILILVIVFILLTILRSAVRKFRIKPPPQNIRQSKDTKDNLKSDDDNIVDAKFEEIK
ncbi:MAG: hypothetical protein ABIY50_07360 [Ignavibacteria bacterium]